MKKHALILALGWLISVAGSSQTPGWKTEHHDAVVVPPDAAQVVFREVGAQSSLTYTVDESYPAQDFVDSLCKELSQAHWEPNSQSDCNKPQWIKEGPPSQIEYVAVLAWKKWREDAYTLDTAQYTLTYQTTDNEPHPHTLHVAAWTRISAVPPAPNELPDKPRPSLLSDHAFILCLLALYATVLVATFWILARSKIQSAVFYNGASAWRTWIHLVLFIPVVLLFVCLGVVLVAAACPSGKENAGQGAMSASLAIWLLLVFSAMAASVAIPIELVVTGSVLLGEEIPRKVKIGHAIIASLSLSYWVFSIAGFGKGLFHW